MIYLDNAATSFPKPEAVYKPLDIFARQILPIQAGPGTKWRWPQNMLSMIVAIV